jgi:hypothetical protein
MQALDEDSIERGGYEGASGAFKRWLLAQQDSLMKAFVPRKKEVTPDFWAWLPWRLTEVRLKGKPPCSRDPRHSILNPQPFPSPPPPPPPPLSPHSLSFLFPSNLQRFCSSTMINLSTQSMLMALGLGAKKTIAASAAINWLLKDGVGRIARMTVATNYCQSFDSDLKVALKRKECGTDGCGTKALSLHTQTRTVTYASRSHPDSLPLTQYPPLPHLMLLQRIRFTTALIAVATTGCEFLTPFYPQHFLALASIANVGKAISLAAFVAVQPAFQRSLCTGSNLADLTAKNQAQVQANERNKITHIISPFHPLSLSLSHTHTHSHISLPSAHGCGHDGAVCLGRRHVPRQGLSKGAHPHASPGVPRAGRHRHLRHLPRTQGAAFV